MKKCVFITGTNCSGKSSLAWAIITRYGGVDRITNDVSYCKEGIICFAGRYGVTRYGGVDRITNDVSYCKEGIICFAGRYGETRYGGVDRITNDKGSSCTSRLAEVVEEGLKHRDIIICEGSFFRHFRDEPHERFIQGRTAVCNIALCRQPYYFQPTWEQEQRKEWEENSPKREKGIR